MDPPKGRVKILEHELDEESWANRRIHRDSRMGPLKCEVRSRMVGMHRIGVIIEPDWCPEFYGIDSLIAVEFYKFGEREFIQEPQLQVKGTGEKEKAMTYQF